MTTGPAACYRCSGTGHVEWARHYANGVCFLCGGTGEAIPGRVESRDDLHTFQVGGMVWQFRECWAHGTRPANGAYAGDWDFCAPGAVRPNGAWLHTVLVQAFAAGQKRKTGRTALRCMLRPEFAREAWKLAVGGAHPDSIANATLGLPEYPASAWSRNRRGIESL